MTTSPIRGARVAHPSVSPADARARRQPLWSRYWLYQRERFPAGTYGVLIAILALGGVSHSMLLRGLLAPPRPGAVLVAFLGAFAAFLQLRVADEIKDRMNDARLRGYLPVPRGIVSLPELAALGAGSMAIQGAAAVWLSPRLILPLAVLWGYEGLMTVEFGVRDRLRARPAGYLASHMLVLPLIVLFVTACDWLLSGGPPLGLGWLLASAYFLGLALEMGRKIRGPDQEEPGVETYTRLWGRPRAVEAWLLALFLALGTGTLAAAQVSFALPFGAAAAATWAGAAFLGRRFLLQPSAARAAGATLASGVAAAVLFGGVGAAPLLLRLAA